MIKKILITILVLMAGWPILTRAQTEFNPNYIISDAELQDYKIWGHQDIQNFLEDRGSYLRNYSTTDFAGVVKSAADIINDAAKTYQINPRYILVTLQKEQSLITADSPTQKQLDWAAGYGVCDNCSMSNPKVQKFQGFGKQVDNAAGIMRWYYDNSSNAVVKKINSPIQIDNTPVTPGSWATAFLYTYTPHLHGNENFYNIWNTWFSQIYPDGTLLKNASTSEYFLIQNGQKRKFKNQTTLITRVDPKMTILTTAADLANYADGPLISLPNYSLLKNNNNYYLVDYDTLRPFASDAVVRAMGYNPDEVIDVVDADIAGYSQGTPITADTVAPAGVIYQVGEDYYLLKNNILKPVTDKSIITLNFKNLPIEKKTTADLKKMTISYDNAVSFQDGTLLQSNSGGPIYAVADGKKRKINGDDTFDALGYKRQNVVAVSDITLAIIPDGEPLYFSSSLLAVQDARAGLYDPDAPVEDLFHAKQPVYLVAEYPSGHIIAGKNADTERPIASLTKILTNYEVLNRNLNLDNLTTYDSDKHGPVGNFLKLETGNKLNNRDIIYSSLVISSNFTTNMLATAVNQNEFSLVEKINQRLGQWQTKHTAVADLTGLSPKNVSTARELLTISLKILTNETIKKAMGTPSYTVNKIKKDGTVVNKTINNINNLMRVENKNYHILASKTGYIDESGSNLLMLIESKTDQKQYLVITLGEADYKNRFKEAGAIASWAVDNNTKLTDTNSSGTSASVAKSILVGTYKFSKDLKNGDNNEDVRQLQLVLKKLGYFTYPTATGKYATLTVEAVKKFQKANKISPVGIVGPQTRAALSKVK